jgi:hypothetical protein
MKKAIILILAVILIVILALYHSYKAPPNYYSKVNLSTKNTVINKSSNVFIDTTVSVGLQKLGAFDCFVEIKNMTDNIQGTFNSGEDGQIDLSAAIIGSDVNYTIYIDPSLNRTDAINIIAHELIHLQQYYYDNLKVLDPLNGIVLWFGEKIDISKFPYDKRPWEIDAFQRQGDLASDMRKDLFQ